MSEREELRAFVDCDLEFGYFASILDKVRTVTIDKAHDARIAGKVGGTMVVALQQQSFEW